MNAKVLFAVVLCAALLATAFVDAKKVKKGGKGKEKPVEKAKVEKREVKAPQVEKIVVVEKVVEKPAAPAPVEEEEILEEEPVHAAHEAAAASPERPPVVKPKHLKIMTAYEECKMQCKKQRDQEDAQQYVERLRAELAQAESLIAEQEAAKAAEAEEVKEAPAVATPTQ